MSTKTYRYKCSIESGPIYEDRAADSDPPTVCKNDGAAIVAGSLSVIDFPTRLDDLDMEPSGEMDFNGCTVSNLSHALLNDVGTNTHGQIDAHLADDSKHAIINDAATNSHELWSASKINAEIAANQISWQGTWTGSPQNYTANDAVEYNGSSYICILNTVSHELPSDNTYWELLAQKGADGTDGTEGSGDVTGPASSLDLECTVFDGTTGKLLAGTGRRDYGALATDPVSPVPVAGDRYYNTAINYEMYYDASRSKWLSIATCIEDSGTRGTTKDGKFFKRHNMTMSKTLGSHVQKGTIVRMAFSMTSSKDVTFEVLVNGVTVAELSSGGGAQASDDSFNADFDEGVMSARNKDGSDDASNLQSIIYYKLRAP